MIEQFHFLRPYWLLTLLPLAWIVWRYWHRQQQGGNWQSVCDPHLLPHLLMGNQTRASRTPILLLASAGVLTILALAGPVWSKLPQPVYHNSAATVVVLNLSDTMRATDVTPTRLERAKLKLLDFLQRQRDGQTALIAYAGEAYVVSPLTDDAATIESLVNSLDTTIMPVAGNNLSEALHKADALLDQDGIYKGGRVLLMTDDAGDRHALQAASALQRKGRVLSILAVGTQHGAPIAAAGGGFIQDSHGAIVVPILNRAALAKLATAGHGHLVMLTTTDADLNQLWPMGEASRFKPQRAGKQHAADVWREQGPWLLLLVLPLVALLWRQGWLAIIVLAVMWQPHPVQASTWSDLWARPDQQAYRALQHGDAKAAAKLFKDPHWRSIAQYRAGNYAAAAAGFAHEHTPDALYNQGNALARAGKLDAAARNYRKVLQQQPANQDAQHNLKIVEDLLKRQQQHKNKNQNKQQGKTGQSAAQNSKQDQSNRQSQAKHGKQNPTGQQQSKNAKQNQTGQQQAKNTRQNQSGKGQSPNAKQHSARQQQAQAQNHHDTGNKQPPASAANKQPAATGQKQSDRKPQTQQAQAHNQSDLGNTAQDKHAATATREMKTKSESAQALEQWLRRIPDDPGGLLRRKFMMQHQQREQADNNRI